MYDLEISNFFRKTLKNSFTKFISFFSSFVVKLQFSKFLLYYFIPKRYRQSKSNYVNNLVFCILEVLKSDTILDKTTRFVHPFTIEDWPFNNVGVCNNSTDTSKP